MNTLSESSPPIWERRPGEPSRWFARFECFRLMGPERTVSAACRASGRTPGKHTVEGTTSGTWYVMARQWDWQARADAWDDHVRAQIRAREEQRRFDRRETRIGMIDQLLNAAFHGLNAAALESMEANEARAALPALRMLFRELVLVQRAELESPDPDAAAQSIQISSEDLRRAYQELAEWQAAGRPPPDTASPPRPSVRGRARAQASTHAPGWAMLPPAARWRLVEVLAELYPDSASIRRVAAFAGLGIGHLALDAAPVDNWHAVIHKAEHGGLLADLAAVVAGEYPGNRPLLEALAGD